MNSVAAGAGGDGAARQPSIAAPLQPRRQKGGDEGVAGAGGVDDLAGGAATRQRAASAKPRSPPRRA